MQTTTSDMDALCIKNKIFSINKIVFNNDTNILNISNN